MVASNMKIATRLWLGFGLLALFILCSGALTLWRAQVTADAFADVMDNRYVKVAMLQEMNAALNLSLIHI